MIRDVIMLPGTILAKTPAAVISIDYYFEIIPK